MPDPSDPTPLSPLLLERLGTGSVYKLVFIGLLSSLVPLGLLMGVLAWIGFDTVNWNGEPVSGPAGLVAGLLAGLWAALALTLVVGSLMALGLWLWSLRRPLRLKARRQPD